MRNLFYAKLAATGMRKNKRFYIPYLLTCIVMTAGFYIMCSISSDPGIATMHGGDALEIVLRMGCFVIGLFAFIFLFYTNSFLTKRRKKEFGLYNVLGMGKRHIARLLVWETLYVILISLVLGLGSGVLLDKLLKLILFRLVSFDIPFGFSISVSGLCASAVLFTCILVLNLLCNLLKMARSSTVELLYGSNAGEKEPKTKWILTIAGILLLGTGYAIALTTKDPIAALSLYFVAVICVILGTYCLFTAVSIFVLKALRRRKSFYYKPSNFTVVSGLIYRMQQNAVGLANICILSTMVLVMVSSTVSLYAGIEDTVSTMFPYDVQMTAVASDSGLEPSAISSAVKKIVAGENLEMKNVKDYQYLSFTAGRTDTHFTLQKKNDYAGTDVCVLCCITADEYTRCSGIPLSLKAGEVLLYGFQNTAPLPPAFTIEDKQYTVAVTPETFPDISDFRSYMYPVYYIVMPDQPALNALDTLQKSMYGENASKSRYELNFDLSGSEEQKATCVDALETGVQASFEELYMTNQAASRQQAFGLYGGFMFLGLFLGIIFTMAAALIIYYKQISEGYDDKERFEILRKVGMSRSEVKHSINKQVLLVFFLPILVASMHLLFNFQIMVKLLGMLHLNNPGLFLICSIITIVVYFLLYTLVYFLTSRVYYKIVS